MLMQIIRPCDPTEASCILANFFPGPPNCDNHPRDARCTKLRLPKAPINTIVKTHLTTVKNAISEDIPRLNPQKEKGLLCPPGSSDQTCQDQQQRQPTTVETILETAKETTTAPTGEIFIIIVLDSEPSFVRSSREFKPSEFF